MENPVSKPTIRKKSRLSAQEGEVLAVAALEYLAAEPDRLSRFLDMSGLGPQTLRKAAADPRFLLSVLDYVIADEPLLIGLAAARETDPERIVAARAAMEA
jgi:hypothetical protein